MNHSVQQIYCSPEPQGILQGTISVAMKKKFLQIHQKHLGLDPERAFYMQYCKMYIEVIGVQKKIDLMKLQIQGLKQELKKAFVKHKNHNVGSASNEASNAEGNKRKRRMANQIARHYTCPVEYCQKSYGSEGSLNYHMKLKHSNWHSGYNILD